MPQAEPKGFIMEQSIKGTFEYEILVTDKSVEFKGIPTLEVEMAALLISKSVVEFAKSNLLENSKQVNGKHINLIRDRLGKATSTETFLSIVLQDYIRVWESEKSQEKPNEDIQVDKPVDQSV